MSGEMPRCLNRYLVPQLREEPFRVTYRCALPMGHGGPCGAEVETSPLSAPTLRRCIACGHRWDATSSHGACDDAHYCGDCHRRAQQAEKANEVLRLVIRDLEADMRTWKELGTVDATTVVRLREAGTTELPMYMRNGQWFVELGADEYKSLAAAVARLTAETRAITPDELRHLRFYVEASGGIHDEDCPQDDTCDCSWKPTLDAVNALCNRRDDS